MRFCVNREGLRPLNQPEHKANKCSCCEAQETTVKCYPLKRKSYLTTTYLLTLRTVNYFTCASESRLVVVLVLID